MLWPGLVQCGASSPAPPGTDASVVPDAPPPDAPPDANACGCPGTELLSREHMTEVWGTVQALFGGGVVCERETDRGITGGCAVTEIVNGYALTKHDFVLSRHLWGCGRNSMYPNVEAVVRCVRPLDRTGEIEEGCVCPELETPLDRLTYPDQFFSVPAGGVGVVDATCPAGSTLLGGGCTGGELGSVDAFLMSGGILPGDPQTWQCALHVPGDRPISSSATAICLNAPGPDAVTGAPVAPEVFEHVSVTETLAANNTRIVDATCEPGDTLIAGGCHVEDADVAFANLRLMRSTLLRPEDNRPNTWQCAWNNPTNATPRVVATATCLKPAGTVPQLQ